MEDYKIRSGVQAEKYVSNELSKLGLWVGDFNKGYTGTQPFDQIAISNNYVWCYDVKHSTIDNFNFSRVEENQELALGFLHKLKNVFVYLGFLIVYQDEIYFLRFRDYLYYKQRGKKSVKITELEKFIDLLVRLGEING